MAHKKAAGSTKNLRDSNPKYLGLKLGDGQKALAGNIIIRQRGTNYVAGWNVGMGKDHTLYALTQGAVKMLPRRKISFTGAVKKITRVSVV